MFSMDFNNSCSTLCFQGFLYNMHPWKMDTVSPFKTEGRALFTDRRNAQLNMFTVTLKRVRLLFTVRSGFLNYEINSLLVQHPLNHFVFLCGIWQVSKPKASKKNALFDSIVKSFVSRQLGVSCLPRHP